MKRQVPKYIYKFNVSTKDYISVYKITIKYQKKKKSYPKEESYSTAPKVRMNFGMLKYTRWWMQMKVPESNMKVSQWAVRNMLSPPLALLLGWGADFSHVSKAQHWTPLAWENTSLSITNNNLKSNFKTVTVFNTAESHRRKKKSTLVLFFFLYWPWE